MVASILALAICAGGAVPAGTLLTYEGEITADRDSNIRKEIAYTALVVASGDSGTHVYWVVSEKGQGAWPWVEQFGQIEMDAQGKTLTGRPATILFEHADGVSPVPLVPPLFASAEELKDGASWRVDRLQYAITKPEDRQFSESSWQIDVATPIGHKRTMLVHKERRVVSDLNETVFVGPGKKHRMQLTLTGEMQLSPEDLSNSKNAFESLFALREDLDHTIQGGKIQWSEDQLAKLKSQLPRIIEDAEGTPVGPLALLAGGDVKLQKAVAAATEHLQKQFVGQQVPKLELKSATLSGSALSTAGAKGKPLVLHIWDYKDNPLVEPYGQIGYLDFLYRRHKDDGLLVFGISIDDRLDRPDARSDGVRSVRKLQSFMNLGYPIVLGGRDVLEAFGDPRRLGAELPLVVVVDRKGVVTHYHLGLYDIDRDKGLAELDAAVEKVK